MGGNIQKGKNQNSNNEKGKGQLISVSDKDLKELANLGEYRWFYCSDLVNWSYYNDLFNEEKDNIIWTIFPLESSNEIERSYMVITAAFNVITPD